MKKPPLTAPGQLVDIGTHRLHLHCAGRGQPTVIFDAALGGSSLSWTLVHPAVATFTKACVYDRAGFAWSDAGPMPRTTERIAEELHQLLLRSGTVPPYVLVGHSFGGLTIRTFAARHAHVVAGLVFVDPAHPEDWVDPPASERARLAKGAAMCRQGAAAARLGLATIVSWLVSAGALTLARGLVKAASRGGLQRQDEQILAPLAKLPAALRPMLKWTWTQPRFYEALGSQIESVCTSAARLERSPDYGDLPLVTISASAPSDRRRALQEALARRSTRGRHIVAAHSGHWIPLEAPSEVIDAIRDVVEDARARNRV